MTWTAQVVSYLADCKRSGIPFAVAWPRAVSKFPPRMMELGVRGEDTLLRQDASRALDWYRDVVRAAYEDAPARDGRPSRLRGLRAALEDGMVRDSVRVEPGHTRRHVLA